MLNTPFNCGATVQKIEVGPQYTDYDLPAHPYVPTVNGTNPMVRTWDWRQWTSLCITNQTEFFQRQVAKDLELIDEQVNKLVIGLLPANYGTFGSGHATPYNLPLFVPNTISSISSPNPNVYTDLEMELLESRITDRAMLLGGTNWKRYSNMMGYSGTSFFGLDASKQTTDMIDLVHDYDINSILSGGAGAAVIVPYKTMQVVQYREYEGEGRYVDMQQHKKFTVMTPAGLWVDMTWDLNLANRCNEVEVSYSVYLDVVSALPGGCNLPAGCNGIMPFVDCSAGASIPCPVTP
jgi:hypothetical protein